MQYFYSYLLDLKAPANYIRLRLNYFSDIGDTIKMEALYLLQIQTRQFLTGCILMRGKKIIENAFNDYNNIRPLLHWFEHKKRIRRLYLKK